MVPGNRRFVRGYFPRHERIRFLHQCGGRHIEQHDGQGVGQAFLGVRHGSLITLKQRFNEGCDDLVV